MINQVKGNELYFAKLREDVKMPTKDSENAGYDIYANFKEDYMLIQPHETKMIPTGLLSACSEDYVILLQERGSTGTKGIAQRCGVIDSGYRGEWFVPITNTTNKPLYIVKKEKLYDLKETLKSENEGSYGIIMQNTETVLEDHVTIYPYEKAITQAIIVPVPKMEVQETSVDELRAIPSKRGEGKTGSSGK